ncbi:Mitochondrial translocator assembly and maintenance protein 41 [Diatrype stigma]|uniref:Phosphatidate cytidylyltransferase, mitochondrial n=1 Tax=Diatrype stigma TaxID=117547 RepID=A0AAN9YRN6_9PEZI
MALRQIPLSLEGLQSVRSYTTGCRSIISVSTLETRGFCTSQTHWRSSTPNKNRPFLRAFASDTSRSRSSATNGSRSAGAKDAQSKEAESDAASKVASSPNEPYSQTPESSSSLSSDLLDWEEKPNFDIDKFTELPYADFGVNQHMIIDREFKEVMRQLLWRFRAPIRYAFAYGSGVFPQSKGGTPTEAEVKAVHPKAPLAIQKAQDGSPKMIDFIFGVQHTQHFHSLNLRQHRDHYSGLGSLGSAAVARVQDKWGAGVYFNPYVTVDGVLIKYGVVNIDTLCRDLRDWDTLYLAGRLQKPVKILRDHPQVRLANQINLMGALRTALLLLPPTFTESELYSTIASISYLGDPRMAFPTENPRKVANIVNHNMLNFRRLYAPLIESLPNVEFNDPACSKEDWIYNTDTIVKLQQDMDPVKRGNMVRRLPTSFRGKLYFEYQKKFQIPQLEFNKMMDESKDEDASSFKRQQGGGFERRIAQDDPEALRNAVRGVIKKTVNWPSTSQSIKSIFTAGIGRSIRYLGEKLAKYREGSKASDQEKSS